MALAPLFQLDDAAFRQRFRHTPLWRARRRGLLRNAAIVLGNQPAPDALPALVQGLHDVDALVRGASAWALGRLRRGGVHAAELEQASDATESDPYVREEIRQALEIHAYHWSSTASQSDRWRTRMKAARTSRWRGCWAAYLMPNLRIRGPQRSAPYSCSDSR